MKILLLTDLPPCTNYTGGMVLAEICKQLPRGSVACFCVLNPDLQNIEPDPDLAWLPLEYAAKPRETGFPAISLAREVLSFGVEWGREVVATPELVKQAASFARRQGGDTIWAVLQGQTMVRLTVRLADQLKMPLYTHIWDPLNWWFDANHVDRWHRKAAFKDFDRAVRSSRACATASWAMSKDYERRYGVRSIALIACYDRAWAHSPAPRLHDDTELVIGMAGQFYADVEWQTLVRCLNGVEWQIAGRQVRLLVLGHYIPESGIPEERCEFLGWHPQREAIHILSEQADVLYCPYPFAPHMAEVARLSFPSKLVSYLAAGRPVLLHGPATSSPARYLDERQAGLVTLGSGASNLFNALFQLAANPDLYAALATKAQQAFAADFTSESMHARILEFLGVSDLELAEARPAPVPFDPKAPAARIPPPRPVRTPRQRVTHSLLSAVRRTPLRRLANALDRPPQGPSLRQQLDSYRSANSELTTKYQLARRELELTQRESELTTKYQLAQRELELTRRGHATALRQLGHTEAALRQQLAAASQAYAELSAAHTQQFEATNRAYVELSTAHATLNQRFDAVASASLGKLSLVEDQLRRLTLRFDHSSRNDASDDGSRYLDLLEAVLTGSALQDPSISPWTDPGFSADTRLLGRDWPQHALTMIGTARMRNLRVVLETALRAEIPGDVIETGVWRGGACIYMRAILAVHGIQDRTVWIADSFQGLPMPNPDLYPADANDTHHIQAALAISAGDVRAAFQRFGLLDGQVQFLEGWFKDTLPNAPIEKIALLRLDGDMYESTWEALEALYPKVSPGGFVIVDDYILPPCRAAVDEYRSRHGIVAALQEVDGAAVYWQKEG